jgi:hypothetical protein
VCAALIVGAAVSCRSRGGEPAAPAPTATAASAASAAPEPAKAPPAGFDRFVGRWTRTDGGYVLDVRSVSPQGAVDAAYLNPRPIHVARAEAFREGESLTLFVELRDANYPGSTYRLVYDPAHDALVGTYFQALQKQSFDVSFERR